jgi:hypothetical protein
MLPICSVSEHHLQRQRGQVDELHGDERALEDRHVGLFGAQKLAVRPNVPAEDNAEFCAKSWRNVRCAGLWRWISGTWTRRPDDLHAFVAKYLMNPASARPGRLTKWLTDETLEPLAPRPVCWERAGLGVETFDGDGVALHGRSVKRNA